MSRRKPEEQKACLCYLKGREHENPKCPWTVCEHCGQDVLKEGCHYCPDPAEILTRRGGP